MSEAAIIRVNGTADEFVNHPRPRSLSVGHLIDENYFAKHDEIVVFRSKFHRPRRSPIPNSDTLQSVKSENVLLNDTWSGGAGSVQLRGIVNRDEDTYTTASLHSARSTSGYDSSYYNTRSSNYVEFQAASYPRSKYMSSQSGGAYSTTAKRSALGRIMSRENTQQRRGRATRRSRRDGASVTSDASSRNNDVSVSPRPHSWVDGVVAAVFGGRISNRSLSRSPSRLSSRRSQSESGRSSSVEPRYSISEYKGGSGSVSRNGGGGVSRPSTPTAGGPDDPAAVFANSTNRYFRKTGTAKPRVLQSQNHSDVSFASGAGAVVAENHTPRRASAGSLEESRAALELFENITRL